MSDDIQERIARAREEKEGRRDATAAAINAPVEAQRLADDVAEQLTEALKGLNLKAVPISARIGTVSQRAIMFEHPSGLVLQFFMQVEEAC